MRPLSGRRPRRSAVPAGAQAPKAADPATARQARRQTRRAQERIEAREADSRDHHGKGRRHRHRVLSRRRAQDGGQLRQARQEGLLRRRHVPSRGEGFVIQGGDPKGNGTGGPGYTIQAEFNKQKHVRGAVAMARTQDPNSAGSQFYICLAPANFLDGQYTVFGIVTKGMDVVDKVKVGDKMKTVKIVRGRRPSRHGLVAPDQERHRGGRQRRARASPPTWRSRATASPPSGRASPARPRAPSTRAASWWRRASSTSTRTRTSSITRCPSAESKVRQGVTTEVVGMCGFSPAPIAPGRAEMVRDWIGGIGDKPARDLADLRTVPRPRARRSGSPSTWSSSWATAPSASPPPARTTRPVTADEQRQMEGLLGEAMDAGAFGYSTGPRVRAQRVQHHGGADLARASGGAAQRPLLLPHPRRGAARSRPRWRRRSASARRAGCRCRWPM